RRLAGPRRARPARRIDAARCGGRRVPGGRPRRGTGRRVRAGTARPSRTRARRLPRPRLRPPLRPAGTADAGRPPQRRRGDDRRDGADRHPHLQRTAGAARVGTPDHARRVLPAAACRTTGTEVSEATEGFRSVKFIRPFRRDSGTPGRKPVSRRRKLLFTSATVVGAVLFAVLALRNTSGPSGSGPDPSARGEECEPTELLEPPCGAWFGAFVPHDRDDLEDKVRAYEERVGRALDRK